MMLRNRSDFGSVLSHSVQVELSQERSCVLWVPEVSLGKLVTGILTGSRLVRFTFNRLSNTGTGRIQKQG
jgi:hypothetical protein